MYIMMKLENIYTNRIIMDFWNGIMEPNLEFAWRFKCTFQYDFISKCLIGMKYAIDGKN
jgi:hypothetical protein